MEIARNYVPNRHVEIALEVSRRLVAIRREEFAADILFEVGRQDEAIDVCINGRKFDKARALSQANAMLRRRVEEAYQSHLVGDEKHSELVDLGKAMSLDVLSQRRLGQGLGNSGERKFNHSPDK